MPARRKPLLLYRGFFYLVFFYIGYCSIFGCTSEKTNTEPDAGKSKNTTIVNADANADASAVGVGGDGTGAGLAGAGGGKAAFDDGGDGGGGMGGDLGGAGGDTETFDGGGDGGNGGSSSTGRGAGAGSSSETCNTDTDSSTEEEAFANFSSGGSGIASVSAGTDYTCAINIYGRLVCWGRTVDLGSPNSGMYIALPIGWVNPLIGSYTQVSTGGGAVCALQTDGRVVCWGTQSPPTNGSFVQVSAARASRACALKIDGNVVCWGKSAGSLEMDIEPAPDPPAGAYIQVIANPKGSITLDSDGAIATWDPSCGSLVCEAVLDSRDFTQISVGSEACAIKKNGSIACVAGKNIDMYGMCKRWLEVLGIPAGSYIQVSAGETQSCALRGDGSVICWGYGSYKESGDYYCVSPTTVPGGHYTAVSAGNNHACAVKRDGTIACWGDNAYGQATVPSGLF